MQCNECDALPLGLSFENHWSGQDPQMGLITYCESERPKCWLGPTNKVCIPFEGNEDGLLDHYRRGVGRNLGLLVKCLKCLMCLDYIIPYMIRYPRYMPVAWQIIVLRSIQTCRVLVTTTYLPLQEGPDWKSVGIEKALLHPDATY